MTLTRLPIDGIVLELWAHPEGSSVWGGTDWGGGTWSALVWRDTTCYVTGARTAWGANRSLGVLSVASGGAWSLETYDPDRALDPANVSSPFAGDIHPGAQMRLRYGAAVLGYASLDEIDFSQRETVGRLQGTDAVGLLLNAKVTAPVSPATTLRALARQLLALTGYTTITVEADPPEGDAPIGAPDTPATGEIGVWATIADASNDALHYAWIAGDLVMRFRSHGDPIDRGLTIGLEGVPNLELVTHSNADGIINRVKAKGTTGTVQTVSDPASISAFGIHELDRSTRKVPGDATAALAWAQRVINERSQASLEYLPLRIIPVTTDDLTRLASMQGVELVRIRDDIPSPPISVDVRALGLQLDASADGWSFTVLGYQSALEWDAGTELPPPIEPPVIPPSQSVQRTYVSSKSTRISKTNTGAKYGSGAEGQLPVGYHSGWIDRALIEFAPVLSDALEITSATLRLRTSTQVNTPFGGNPRFRVQRITESWSEGSASSPSGGNATVYPGPSATATGEANKVHNPTESITVDVDITAIVRAWAPVSAGGSGAANRGVRLISWDESDTNRTTEFLSDDTGTSSNRPTLIVNLKIPA